jgi:hypothetical protein
VWPGCRQPGIALRTRRNASALMLVFLLFRIYGLSRLFGRTAQVRNDVFFFRPK